MNQFNVTIAAMFLIISGLLSAQCDRPTKTFDDTTFNKDDEMKVEGIFISTTIQPFSEMGKSLTKAIDFMIAHPNMIFEVSAHTGYKGRDDYNMLLSKRYIKIVWKWINARHPELLDRIEFKALGESDPLYDKSYLSTVDFEEKEELDNCNNRIAVTILATNESEKLMLEEQKKEKEEENQTNTVAVSTN